jgi:3-deoxy-D-manno-octulosonic-acid transferase
MIFLFYIYRYFISPILILLFFFLLPFSKKLRQSFQLRKPSLKRPIWSARPVWIHASSGEFEYAKSIIREFKNENPHTPVLVTYYSPSYAKAIVNYPGVDHTEPLPFDLPQSVISFLKHYQPRALLIARTDLWPEVLYQCKRQNIPVLLFATTFRPLTGFRKLLTPFYQFLFQMTQDVFCVSRYDTENLKSVCSSSAKGDPRYDQVHFRNLNARPLNHSFSPATSTNKSDNSMLTLIAGSTWAHDENQLLPAVLPFLKEKKYKLIIAPHEPTDDHILKLNDYFHKNNIPAQLYSHEQAWSTPVLIVDQVGVLADIYARGHVAFVGGSFKSKVHSVMEPLGHGLLTLVGPYFNNNREATEFHKLTSYSKISAVTACRSSVEIVEILDFIHKNKDYVTELKNWIQIEFKKRLGATRHVLDWLRPYLNS